MLTFAQGLRRRRAQSGAVFIMFAGALVILLAFVGLALDLARLYNRKMELQTVADTVAMAAALELNGTAPGITNALQRGAERFIPTDTGALTYDYGGRSLVWTDSAMTLSASPAGPWKNIADAKAKPDGLLYVKVETARMDPKYSQVQTIFMQLFSRSSVNSTSARAIAGHSALNITPLGICAMREERQRDHKGELEEFGFRRGIVYDLLALSRTPASAGDTFLINPMPGTSAQTAMSAIAPFVCSGTMAMGRVTGGKVVVSSPFPLASLYEQINSRFGIYGSSANACTARSAPPDANVKAFSFDAGTPWMGTTPAGPAAAGLVSSGRRWTIAGPDNTPPGTSAAQYGPLWSYARAARYSASVTGAPEPAQGYSTFAPSDWATLYTPGGPAESLTTPYPSAANTPTPYWFNSGSTFFKPPSDGGKSLRERRVLNLPLLACPVTGSQAQIVGIGKFFMTVPATASTLYGEFGGLIPEQSLRTQLELYP